MSGHFRGKVGNPPQKFGGTEAQNWVFTHPSEFCGGSAVNCEPRDEIMM